MSYLYLVSIGVFTCLSVLMIYLFKYFKKKPLTNIIFVSIITPCYIALVVRIYFSVGFNDWNFTNALPIANVSPFMFFILPLFFALPKVPRKYFGILIALLCVGMFISPTASCIRYFSINYKFHAHFLLDLVSHYGLFLWGIYLVHSKQVELNVRDSLIGGSIIVAVALTMLIINAIFRTGYFGLHLYGKHNIYNVVLVDNSFLSALIYFTGLISALILGFFFQKGLLMLMNKLKHSEEERK